MRASIAEGDGGPDTKTLGSLRAIGVAVVRLYRTRLELFLAEVEREQERLERRIILWLTAGFFLATGSLVATAWFIWLLVPLIGKWAVALFALFYLGAGGVVCGLLHRRNKQRRAPFAFTLKEFEKDAECFGTLVGKKESHAPGEPSAKLSTEKMPSEELKKRRQMLIDWSDAQREAISLAASRLRRPFGGFRYSTIFRGLAGFWFARWVNKKIIHWIGEHLPGRLRSRH